MFPTLPISYCTNVHPGTTLAEVVDGLRSYTGPLNATAGPVAAGLWLAESVMDELRDAGSRAVLAKTLGDLDLVCYTLNAFPQGNFHQKRVKEDVYRPTWADAARLEYTSQCARVLSELLPDGVEGSLSTVPLGHPADAGEGFEAACVANLLELTRRLDDLHDETGRVVRLAVEPEPCCVLETVPQTCDFFGRLFEAADAAGLSEAAARHLGVCYDVCHHAVEFEDAFDCVRRYRDAGVRINKVHVSCALEADPADAAQRSALAAFAEPRYLHQTFARSRSGEVARVLDLTAEFCDAPPDGFAEAAVWRTHFHVPVNAESVGGLRTTRPELGRALRAVHELPYAPHVEVETYTWGVLPGEKPDLVAGLSAEVRAAREMVEAASRPAEKPAGPMVTLG